MEQGRHRRGAHREQDMDEGMRRNTAGKLGTGWKETGGFLIQNNTKKLVCPVVSKICTAPTDGT